ncbi:MAG: carboxypeptidase-like regulatory domain-containing protein [Saprospiraceae bacterium]
MKKSYCSILWSVVFVLISLGGFAQSTIRGVIKDMNSGEPLIGATILINQTGEGTVTDFDGAFELNTSLNPPFEVEFSYTGYSAIQQTIQDPDQKLNVKLEESAITIAAVEVKGQRISDKQKAAPLTVESMDLLAIKNTASDNFYDGLGSMKGVDLTAASLGFKIINTRGFNSTSPVRSLQIIDGIDNQAPGLNFSLGNFLGSSELDVVKVDLIQGASSAFYGPNAFNGVISMETKNPFMHKGLAGSVKVGERSLVEAAIRFADAVQNADGNDVFAYKFNFSYLTANDWVADNFNPVDGTETGIDNPGRYDAVNIYGDEFYPGGDYSGFNPPSQYPGLGIFHRTGYREEDLVDYGTKNLKSNLAFHFRTNPSMKEESPEVILAGSFSTGTTVYQGDNRFSLRNIVFAQPKIEFKKKDKFFIRAYMTFDDAGDSYDPYFTALALLDSAGSNFEWAQAYENFWRNPVDGQGNFDQRAFDLGFPMVMDSIGPDGEPVPNPNTGLNYKVYDYDAWRSWLQEYKDTLFDWHRQAENYVNGGVSGLRNLDPYYEPGTERFNEKFNEIISKSRNDGGTRFIDRSALYHVHGEYSFDPGWVEFLKVGGNVRFYRPESEGTIFYDTAGITLKNYEFGFYTGAEKVFFEDKLRAQVTVRADKNQNFDWLVSPAASLVFKPKANNYLRFSFSSAIRNPTLTDQYLNLNVGRATLSGNLDGVQDLVTTESLVTYLNTLSRDSLQYFDIPGVMPEKVKTFEVGYRTTLFNNTYVDANYYYNIYNDFLGYNIGAEIEFDPTFGRIRDIDIYRYAANSTETVTTQGFSIGMNYYFLDYYQLAGNYSWNKLNTNTEDPIVPAFNTPEHKYNISLSGRNITWNFGNAQLRNFGFNINYKWIEGFIFEGSPQFTGSIPTYSLLDAQVSFGFPKINTTLKIGASNLLNNKNFQTYGGPRIGRLAFVSLVYDWKKI